MTAHQDWFLFYLVAVAGITLPTGILMRETKYNSLIHPRGLKTSSGLLSSMQKRGRVLDRSRPLFARSGGPARESLFQPPWMDSIELS